MRIKSILIHYSLFTIPLLASAAVTQRWTVETSRVQPVVFDAVRGETLSLEAAFQSHGKALAMPTNGWCMLWQTNGMGSAWWSAGAEVEREVKGEGQGQQWNGSSSSAVGSSSRPYQTTNWVVKAEFTPAMDPGSDTVIGFLGATGQNYRASFRLRFRHGPGERPNTIAAPVPILDLAHTTVINPPWPTAADFAATTTVMKAELKDYVDEQVEATGVVTPQSVTNAASSIITNHVASGYLCTKEFLISATGDIYNDAVNDAGVKVPEIVTRQYIKDLTFLDGFTDYTTGGKTYRKTNGNIYFDGANIKVSDGNTPALVTTLGSLVTASTASINGQPLTYGGNIVISTSSIGAVPNTRKVNGQPLTSDITIESMPDNGLVLTNNAVKTKSGTTITAAHVGAASAAEVQGKADASTVYTKTQSDAAFYPKQSGDAWAAFWDGDEVRVTVTNYYGQTDLPHLYLEQRTNETGTAKYKTVWDEHTRWRKFVGGDFNWNAWGGFHSFKTNATARLDELEANKADRAWGFYDSSTGDYAPANYTSVSSSNLMIAAGLAYQRTVTTSGCAVWVLTATEPTTINGTTNGAFQVKDADGNVQVEIVKGDKRTVGARCGGVSVSGAALVANYAVASAEHPTLEVCTDLATAAWKAEDAADCPATVSWSGSSGAWTATVTPSAGATTVFVKASYQVGGDTIFKSNVPVKFSQIIIGTTKYNIGTATVSGSTVLTLTPTL